MNEQFNSSFDFQYFFLSLVCLSFKVATTTLKKCVLKLTCSKADFVINVSFFCCCIFVRLVCSFIRQFLQHPRSNKFIFRLANNMPLHIGQSRFDACTFKTSHWNSHYFEYFFSLFSLVFASRRKIMLKLHEWHIEKQLLLWFFFWLIIFGREEKKNKSYAPSGVDAFSVPKKVSNTTLPFNTR